MREGEAGSNMGGVVEGDKHFQGESFGHGEGFVNVWKRQFPTSVKRTGDDAVADSYTEHVHAHHGHHHYLLDACWAMYLIRMH